MSNYELLLNQCGYKEYPKPSYELYNKVYQKTIKSADQIKLYFIDIRYWQFNNKDCAWDAIAWFYNTSDEFHGFQVTKTFAHNRLYKENIIDLEEFFHNIYKNMKCIPDIHNN